MGEEKGFLQYWFEGFQKGLETLDEAGTDAMLRECGKACAASYTARVFREEWAKSTDLDSFLAGLQGRFPDSGCRRLDENRVLVTFGRCTCDLVVQGYVKTPTLCRCSVHNLKENFMQAMGREVWVEMVSSILGGGERCEFIVTIK